MNNPGSEEHLAATQEHPTQLLQKITLPNIAMMTRLQGSYYPEMMKPQENRLDAVIAELWRTQREQGRKLGSYVRHMSCHTAILTTLLSTSPPQLSV